MKIELPQKKCYECKFRRSLAGSAHSSCSKTNVIVQAEEHGIKKGWFVFPYDFDPNWLISCTGFRPKDDNLETLSNKELVALASYNIAIIDVNAKQGNSIIMKKAIEIAPLLNKVFTDEVKDIENFDLINRGDLLKATETLVNL